MEKKNKNQELRKLPSIDQLLHASELHPLIEKNGRSLVTYAARQAVSRIRAQIGKKREQKEIDVAAIIKEIEKIVLSITQPSLKPVINATGIVLHTNLGRAPMGDAVLHEIGPIISGYSNVEFDCAKAARGHRNDHIAELLRYLTGAEESLVVNNNAAAIFLALHTLAYGREVIISRGELIEIGGAFRIPDIMLAAGVNMVEVGTTNRTRLADYQKAISAETALIVKAHRSNFAVSGFTEEVTVGDLAAFANRKKLPLLYDIGSGLLRRPTTLHIEAEPDVRSALTAGAGLVAFSGDKLLGGPQAGIIAGKSRLVRRLAAAPLMRALRVGKLTLAALAAACRTYLHDTRLVAANPVFGLFERTIEERRRLAAALCDALARRGVQADITESEGQCGGGTLPDVKLPSCAVTLAAKAENVRQRREAFAERIFLELLKGDRPVLAVLREGRLVFDVFALKSAEIEPIAARTAECIESMRSP